MNKDDILSSNIVCILFLAGLVLSTYRSEFAVLAFREVLVDFGVLFLLLVLLFRGIAQPVTASLHSIVLDRLRPV